MIPQPKFIITTRRRVDYNATYQNLKSFVAEKNKNLPDAQQIEELKGNVFHTAKEIYRIWMSDIKNRKTSNISPIIKTKHTSLATHCKNSGRTIQRHVDKLLSIGIIVAKKRFTSIQALAQGKVQIKGGINLCLNEAILSFIEHTVKEPVHATPTNIDTPSGSITAKIKSIKDLDLFNLKNENHGFSPFLG